MTDQFYMIISSISPTGKKEKSITRMVYQFLLDIAGARAMTRKENGFGRYLMYFTWISYVHSRVYGIYSVSFQNGEQFLV